MFWQQSDESHSYCSVLPLCLYTSSIVTHRVTTHSALFLYLLEERGFKPAPALSMELVGNLLLPLGGGTGSIWNELLKSRFSIRCEIDPKAVHAFSIRWGRWDSRGGVNFQTPEIRFGRKNIDMYNKKLYNTCMRWVWIKSYRKRWWTITTSVTVTYCRSSYLNRKPSVSRAFICHFIPEDSYWEIPADKVSLVGAPVMGLVVRIHSSCHVHKHAGYPLLLFPLYWGHPL